MRPTDVEFRLWGVASANRRIKAVVSQAMTISGQHNLELRHASSAYRDLRGRIGSHRHHC